MTIRDPSDGTTYNPPKGKPVLERPVLDTDTTGLPAGSTKSKDILKLERSREWLRKYKQGDTDAV